MEGQQLLPIQGKLDAVELSVSTLQSRVSDFESHPPTIGEVSVEYVASLLSVYIIADIYYSACLCICVPIVYVHVCICACICGEVGGVLVVYVACLYHSWLFPSWCMMLTACVVPRE